MTLLLSKCLALATTTAILISVLLLLTTTVNAAPVKKRLLLPNAPLASTVNGAHLMLINDMDSNHVIKNAYLLLSQPRDYYSGMSACTSMGDGGYIYIGGTSGATELVSLLKKNANAQAEVDAYNQFWVYNGIPGILSNCLAVNKNTGNTDWIPCNTQLPTICFNSVMRRILLFDDTSRQIKVQSPAGAIQGWRDQNAFRFLGIPYAKPPVGTLRFADTQPADPIQGTLDAMHYRNICPQTNSNDFIPLLTSYLENGATESEDCLNLNVYTPSLKGTGAAGLPVMFYVHGGGFTSFSGSTILFEPGNLVSRGGVVVVTINYRLGVLGWFENDPSIPRSTVPGNQALRDQIMALKWVRDNIASFGGDPSRVTIFGESAGGTSMRALLSIPSAFGLYQNVISESDPINLPFAEPAISSNVIGNYTMQELGCGQGDLTCARSRPVSDILAAQARANARVTKDYPWIMDAEVYRPVIDGQLIAAEFSQLVKAGTYNTKANIMWGTVHDEAGLFVPQYFPNVVPIANVTDALGRFFSQDRVAMLLASGFYSPDPADPDAVRDLFTRAGTDYYFFCPLRYLSRQVTTRSNVYNFRFNRGRDVPLLGNTYCSEAGKNRVCHAFDIQPVFGSGGVIPTIAQTGDDARFALQIVDRFTTFAKSGNPNPTTALQGFEIQNPDVVNVNWPRYSDSDPIMELNLQSTVSMDDQEAACHWADTTFLYDFWLRVPGNSP